jgi:hypothetical protein
MRALILTLLCQCQQLILIPVEPVHYVPVQPVQWVPVQPIIIYVHPTPPAPRPLPAPPEPPAPPVDPKPTPAPEPASGQIWAYYLLDAQKATPGQYALTDSTEVRQAVRSAGMSWRLIRSDQALIESLNLRAHAERLGYPLFLIVDAGGKVLIELESPMPSDIVAAVKGASRAR